MKVIDLLKLIQEGKQPKEVIYKEKKYKWCEDIGDYRRDGCYECLLMTKIFEYDSHMHNSLYNMIYDEVEIIEDKSSKIEEEHDFYNYASYNNNKKDIDKILYIIRAINKLEEKYSTIAKAVNYLLEKSDSNE